MLVTVKCVGRMGVWIVGCGRGDRSGQMCRNWIVVLMDRRKLGVSVASRLWFVVKK